MIAIYSLLFLTALVAGTVTTTCVDGIIDKPHEFSFHGSKDACIRAANRKGVTFVWGNHNRCELYEQKWNVKDFSPSDGKGYWTTCTVSGVENSDEDRCNACLQEKKQAGHAFWCYGDYKPCGRLKTEAAVGITHEQEVCIKTFRDHLGQTQKEAEATCLPKSQQRKTTKKPAGPVIDDCCTTWKSTNDQYCKIKGNDNGCGRKLRLGEGDCDWHCDCEGMLMCGSNNCPWGDGDDCCRNPTDHEIRHVIKQCGGNDEAVFMQKAEEPITMNDVALYGFAAAGLGFLVYGAVKFTTQKSSKYVAIEV